MLEFSVLDLTNSGHGSSPGLIGTGIGGGGNPKVAPSEFANIGVDAVEGAAFVSTMEASFSITT